MGPTELAIDGANVSQSARLDPGLVEPWSFALSGARRLVVPAETSSTSCGSGTGSGQGWPTLAAVPAVAGSSKSRAHPLRPVGRPEARAALATEHS